jgi:hypothetical protein
VYWTGSGAEAVQKIDKRGGAASTVAALNANSNLGVAVFGRDLYWTDSGSVYHTDVDGLTRIDLVATSGQWMSAMAIAADASGAYWTESGKLIRRVTRAGATPTTIATQEVQGDSDLVMDGRNVYWSNCAAGTIMWVRK